MDSKLESKICAQSVKVLMLNVKYVNQKTECCLKMICMKWNLIANAKYKGKVHVYVYVRRGKVIVQQHSC